MSSTDSPISPTLDHLILLLPCSPTDSNSPGTFSPLVPSSISQAFIITPGGTHADGLTANVLIPLRSGTYLELITFSPHTPVAIRAAHWWADKSPGFIDWSLSSATGPAHVSRVLAHTRLYDHPVRGGRTRPDGERVEWQVTFPRVGRAKGESGDTLARGALPFWCHDETSRELRVPGNEASVNHPSGAMSVARVRIAASSKALIEQLRESYEPVFGAPRIALGGGTFEFDVEAPIEGYGSCTVEIGPPRDDTEQEMVRIPCQRGVVIAEVVIYVGQAEPVPEPIREEAIDGCNIRMSFVSGP